MKLKTIEKDGIKITAAFISENEVNEKIKMRAEYDLGGEARPFEAYPDADKNGKFTIAHQFEYVKADRNFENKLNARERIGKRIAELRNEKGLSQARLAELTGLGQGHIARVELGKYSAGVDTLEKIADVFGMEISLTDKKR